MTNEQFKNLKVGDMCVVSRGRDADRLVQVAFIEKEGIVIRSADGKRFHAIGCYGPLRLTGSGELKIFKP
jgi:hypothetical protein